MTRSCGVLDWPLGSCVRAGAKLGEPPRQVFVTQLEEARAEQEYFRRVLPHATNMIRRFLRSVNYFLEAYEAHSRRLCIAACCCPVCFSSAHDGRVGRACAANSASGCRMRKRNAWELLHPGRDVGGRQRSRKGDSARREAL